jgi:hypothetical protein
MASKLTKKQVTERYGGVTTKTIERWTEKLGFPQPVKFGSSTPKKGRCFYDLDEVEAWERARALGRSNGKEQAHA